MKRIYSWREDIHNSLIIIYLLYIYMNDFLIYNLERFILSLSQNKLGTFVNVTFNSYSIGHSKMYAEHTGRWDNVLACNICDRPVSPWASSSSHFFFVCIKASSVTSMCISSNVAYTAHGHTCEFRETKVFSRKKWQTADHLINQ